MTFRTRLLSLTLMLALLVGLLPVAAPANAQDNCPPDLSSDDCQLLNDATNLLRQTSSFNISDYTFDFQIRTNGDTNLLETSGDGPVLFDNGVIVGLDVSFDPATLTNSQETQTGGGVLRFNADGIFLGMLDEDGNLIWSGLPADAEIDGTSANDLSGIIDDLGLGDANFDDLLMFSRADDETVDGRDVAVFVVDIDPASFITSPLFIELITQAASGLLDDQGIDPALAAILLQSVLDGIAEDLTEDNIIQSRFYVDLETLEVTYFSLLVDLSLDLSSITSLVPDFDAIIPGGQLGIGLDLQANIDQYNGEFTIETPAEYDNLEGDITALFGDLAGGAFPFDLGFSPDGGDSGVDVEGTEFAIEAGNTITGTLSSDNETDSYSFTGSAGDEIQIAVRAVNPDDFLDTIVDLYDANGELVDQNDDGSNVPEAFDLGFFDSYLTLTLPEDGEYVIVVGSVFSVETADYELTLVQE